MCTMNALAGLGWAGLEEGYLTPRSILALR